MNKSDYYPEDLSDDSSESSGGKEETSVATRRKALNEFLLASGSETISEPRKAFSELTDRKKKDYVSKAGNAIISVLNVIAPGDAGNLWDAIICSGIVDNIISDGKICHADKKYLEALAETYQNAKGSGTRRQILSIIADIIPPDTIKQYIPNITEHLVKGARRHIVEIGRGKELPENRSPRMRVTSSQLDHFLSFITSPHVIQDLPFGQRYLHLSNGKIIETPNIIRCMIPQRIIRQYEQYCKESDIKPFSKSTMERILSSCSATVRKSLQGLDYYAAEGAKAFDELENLVIKLGNLGNNRQIGSKVEKALRDGKQYLKTDYKVGTIDYFQ